MASERFAELQEELIITENRIQAARRIFNGNVRDYRIDANGSVQPHFIDRSFRTDAVERAWFLVEPFSALPIEGYQGIAHTYFAFDISGQPPITLSVEARRERQEAARLT